MRSELKSPRSITVWLVYPELRLIRKQKWTGDWSDIDDLLDNSELDTVHSDAILFRMSIGLIYSCGSKNENSNYGWRLRDDNFQAHLLNDKSNFSNLMLTCVEKEWGVYDEDCPLSVEELVSRLDWIEHNSDFSEIIYHSARLDDIEPFSVNL